MACGDYREGILSDIYSQGNVFPGKGGVDEVIVVTGQEQTTADAFCHPFLMKHQAIVLGNSKVEQGGFTGTDQIETKVLSDFPQTIGQLGTKLTE